MTQGFISAREITAGLPEQLRPFLLVDSAQLPLTLQPVVSAFWEAATVIRPAINLRRSIHILIGASPFQITIGTGVLVYTVTSGINTYVEDFVFIDCARLAPYPYQIQVAAILEELVHVLMNVTDEDLVTQIVGWLYKGVKIVNGKYSL